VTQNTWILWVTAGIRFLLVCKWLHTFSFKFHCVVSKDCTTCYELIILKTRVSLSVITAPVARIHRSTRR